MNLREGQRSPNKHTNIAFFHSDWLTDYKRQNENWEYLVGKISLIELHKAQNKCLNHNTDTHISFHRAIIIPTQKF